MRELTSCQAKNATRGSKLSASFQLQLPWENIPTVKTRIPQEHQDCQLHSSSSHLERTYKLSSQECHKSIKTLSFIPAAPMTRKLTSWQAKNAPRASRLSALFQLQPPWENLPTIKTRMPQEQHQDCQLHSSSSNHKKAYPLSRPTRASRPSASFQLQPPWENLHPGTPRMSQEHQDYQLYSSSSCHKRTYVLSSQECHQSIKTVSFIPAPATDMGELTSCQAKNATRASGLSASIQLQPPLENLPTVKPRMPPEHQDCQLYPSSSHHKRTYSLSRQECHKSIKTVSFIPAPATMKELTSCQAKNAPRASRLSASFQL